MPKILSPSDKFQLRGLGDLMHPGKCLACGSGNFQGGYIDLGTYFDYEGQMYLCGTCMEEAAEVLGMLTLAETKFLQEQDAKLATENARLKEELDAASNSVNMLKSVMREFASHDVVDNLTTETTDREPVETSDDSVSADAIREQASAEPVVSERPVHVERPEPSHGISI